ncbi:hypothetical protein Tco_1348086 [Tanacetum coccineum]
MKPTQSLTAIQTMLNHDLKNGTTEQQAGILEAVVARWARCFGPHLDKDCPLNEEVKQVEEVRYGEFGRTTPFNGNNGGKFHVGPPGYYTKTDNRPPYGERRQSLEELLAKHQEESARRSTKMEVWIKKLQENAEINTRNQNASLKNLETQIEQLTEELCSRKEKSEQAKVVIVEHEGPSSPKKLKNLHGISFLFDSQEENTIDQLPTKESNPGHFTLPCTIGHLDISKSVRKDLFRLWMIDQFTEASDPDKNPLERCLDEYKWVFHSEIEELADEYKIKIREKGQILEEIWTKYKRAQCKNKDWWYDYWYEDEEKTELGSEDYNSPMVHIETFEVTKYKFNNGCSFICVSGKNNETLSLGRKNGLRFRKMIMEEMEEVLGNDGEDSDDKT